MEAVEIKCRCKDCANSIKLSDGSFVYCYFWANQYAVDTIAVDEDDFCSYGEVKNA